MSESNLSDKIIENVVDGITNIIKKTIIFEKTERIKGMLFGFTLCSSIVGLFTIYNTYTTVTNKEEIKNTHIFLKSIQHYPRIYYKLLTEYKSILYNLSIKFNKIDDKFDKFEEKNKEKIYKVDDKIDKLNEKIDKLIGIL